MCSFWYDVSSFPLKIRVLLCLSIFSFGLIFNSLSGLSRSRSCFFSRFPVYLPDENVEWNNSFRVWLSKEFWSPSVFCFFTNHFFFPSFFKRENLGHGRLGVQLLKCSHALPNVVIQTQKINPMKIPHFLFVDMGITLAFISLVYKRKQSKTREQKIDQVHDMDMHGCDLLVEWKLRPISWWWCSSWVLLKPYAYLLHVWVCKI